MQTNPPVPSLSLTASSSAIPTTLATRSVTVGACIVLDASGSRDPDGGMLSYAWTLVSKPASSTALLSATMGAFSQLTSDALGDYVVKLVATDPSGASSDDLHGQLPALHGSAVPAR